ncbi:hypothetical protein ACFW2Y_29145 [Streptomyces sp. NPDC058877]|uniref:hypothetical protein n=1 Tax=Streptomyces sp. NPDC058877 TaxID=3346665 RepID=UPI00367DCB5D
MLEVLGLDSGTEVVYRLMLTHPGWGVDRLAGALDTDRHTVVRADWCRPGPVWAPC